MNQPPPFGYPPASSPFAQGPAAPAQTAPSPSYAPPPYYAYAPPAAYGPAFGAATSQGPGGTGAPAARWVVFGSFVGAIVLMGLGGAIQGAAGDSDAGATLGGIFAGLGMILLPVYFVSALVWLYKSWEMIPASQRFSGNGTRVTPGGAVGFLFVPFYNLYWYFIVSAGLCTALNRELESLGSAKRASRGLAITAAVMQVIPYVNLLLAPFFWLAFMFNVESAKREYARLAANARAAALV